MTDGADGAERSCVVCRRRAPREDLFRVVLGPDGRPWFDFRGSLPGRGAWVCARKACVGSTRLGGRLAQALESTGLTVEGGWAEGEVRAHVSRRLRERLGLLCRSGAGRVGNDSAGRSLDTGWARFVLVASDASEGTARRVAAHAAAVEVPVYRLSLAASEVGAAVGRPPVAVVAVGAGPLSQRLEKELQSWSDFL